MAQFGRTATLIGENKSGERVSIQGGLLPDNKDGLRIAFNIQKSGVALNTAEIKIYNIEKETIEFFSDKEVNIEFYAGYLDHNDLIFKGKIKNTTHERVAPDDVTTIYSSSGLTSIKSSFSNTIINKGDDVADAVQRLLKDITDLQTGFVDKLPACKKWIRSQTISGQTFDIISRLGEECGFRISVNDEKVEIHRDTFEPTGKNLIVLNSNTGLLDIPVSTEIGVDFTALLNPNLTPNNGVQIESKSFSLGISNAGFYEGRVYKDGRYGILTTNFIGDTHGTEWSAKCKTKYWGGTMQWRD